MSRSPEYTQGRRAGVKWAITWLHDRANEMNDPHAKAILNTAAFNLGADAKGEPKRRAGFWPFVMSIGR